jgi:hypothetical protein
MAATDLFFGRNRFDFGLIRLFSAFLWGEREVRNAMKGTR